MNETDERHLRRAIELAGEARAAGDMPFGSLLVGPAGQVLAEDRNTVPTRGARSPHPEFKPALWASRERDPETAARTTMYTSCQPCAMCSGAIARSGLGRVVYALSSDQLGSLGGTRPASPRVALDGPALFDEARVPVEGYYG